jgi:hypothetical protein
MTLEQKVQIICLGQIDQSSLLIDLSTESHGDCRYCKPDYNNSKCNGYYPIKLYRMEIKDDM